MATRAKKTKFDLDKMVTEAHSRVQEFIDAEFVKLQTEIKADFKKLRKVSK